MAGGTTQVLKMTLVLKLLAIFFVMFTRLDCVLACEEGQYFDKDVKTCEYCYIICDNPVLTDTVLKCHKNCPDYLKQAKSTFTVAPATTQTTEGTEILTTIPTLLRRLSTGHIVGITVGVTVGVVLVVAGLIAAVVLYIIRSRRKDQKHPVMVVDDRNGEGEITPGLRQNDKLITESMSTVGDCCV